jgi:hypothetical protein
VIAKPGHPADRRACAQFAREQRARFHQLHGGWTRKQWNHNVMQAAENKLALLTKARREQQREHAELVRQVAANRRDELSMAMNGGML